MTDAGAEEMIAEDLPCIHCSYNLRTRLFHDNCPECGLPVAPSVKAHRDPQAIVPHPRFLSNSLAMVALSFSLQLTLLLLTSFDLHTPIPELLRIAWMLLTSAGILLTVYAMKSSVASPPWLRYGVTCVFLSFTASAFIEPVRQLKTWSAGGFFGTPMFPVQFYYVARDLGSFSLTLLIAGLMIQLLRLNKFLPAPKLRTATWFICLPVVIGVAAMLTESITREIAFERGVPPVTIQRTTNLFMLVELPCLIAWPAMVILMLLYRRAIHRLTRKTITT